MGYRDRTITLDFSDLAEDGDEMHVTIRNPKLLTADKITPGQVPNGPDGQPDEKAAEQAMFTMLASLITEWRMFDPDTDELLGAPSPETVARLPITVVSDISKQIEGAVAPK